MNRTVKTTGAILLVVLLGIGAAAPIAAQGDVVVTINAPTQVDPGSDFTATVAIGEVTGLNAVQYDISFNPSVLELADITSGQVGSTEMTVMCNEVSAGTYRVVQSLGFSTVDGSGHLAVLHFHALQAGESEASLSSGVLAGMEGEIGAAWTGDSVVVGSGSPPSPPPPSNPPPPAPSPPPTPPGAQLPNVVSISPTTDAVEVPVTATVEATFDRAMDSRTITTGSFSLGTDSAVSGTVSYDAAAKTATFTPDTDLEPGAIYTAVLSSTIADADGNPLAGMSCSFTTERAPAEVPSHVAGVPAVEDADTSDEAAAPLASHRELINWVLLGAGICVVVVLLIVVISIIRRRAYYGY